jgi:hypothetical protein
MLIQIIAWAGCWYWLFTPVPIYKECSDDFSDVESPAEFRVAVDLSDYLVIKTRSDGAYVASAVAFLAICVLINGWVIATLRRGRLLGVWTVFATSVPVVLLGFLVVASQRFVAELMGAHPEVANWGIVWLDVLY